MLTKNIYLIKLAKCKVERDKYSNMISEAGYDERSSANVLESEYLK